MNFQRVHYFLTFCESMHFSNAAKQLCISQPALAKAIDKLEQELGVRLVRREGKHTHLTPQGRAARQMFSGMMEHVYKVDSDIGHALNGSYEQLHIGVNSLLGISRFAKFTAAFHLAHPKVRIDIVDCETDDCDELLLKGDVDCLITHDCEAIDKRVTCVHLYNEKWVVVGAVQETQSSNAQQMIGAAFEQFTEIDPTLRTIYNVENSFVSGMVKCRKQLWVQQLVKHGVGYGVVPASSELIDGIGIFESVNTCKTMTVSAAIPVGRNDCQSIANFHTMLRQYNWEHPAASSPL